MIENVWSPLRLFWWSWGGDKQNFQAYIHPHSIVIISENQMEVNLTKISVESSNHQSNCQSDGQVAKKFCPLTHIEGGFA
jgi:hypothetical protein